MTSLRDMAADLGTPNTTAPTIYMPVLKTEEIPRGQLSPEMREVLDDLFSALDKPIDDDIAASAITAAEGRTQHLERVANLHKVADDNKMRAYDLRNAFYKKDIMETPRAAIDKLNEIKVQEKFVVPDHMAHNMQALVSKRNQRENGKRFKTARVAGDDSFLQVWRTR